MTVEINNEGPVTLIINESANDKNKDKDIINE